MRVKHSCCINACFPAGIEPLTIEADDQSVPAKLIVTGKRTQEAPQEAIVAAVNKESPPAKPKKNESGYSSEFVNESNRCVQLIKNPTLV
mgnify:CR=1 FL=1